MQNQNTQIAYKSLAWFTSNAEITLDAGIHVNYEQTGLYKVGNGSTKLSLLAWLGGGVSPSPSILPTGSKVGIVAGTTQTQAGATQLTKKRNIVATVAVAGDGIKASAAVENMEQYYKNEGANWFWFYPTLGNNFIGLSANIPITIMPNNGGIVYCYEGEAGILRYK